MASFYPCTTVVAAPTVGVNQVATTDLFDLPVNGSGGVALTTLGHVDRNDFLAEDLSAWDNANGHGLGAPALGLQARAAANVSPEIPSGFNIEGLTMAPDRSTAYVAFRAPMLPPVDEPPVTPQSSRSQALIVQVLNFDTLIVDGLPGSRAPDAATFGAPILLDPGARALRSIEHNANRQYLISAGSRAPPGPVQEPRLYAWNGATASAPVLLAVDLAGLQGAGAFESIINPPSPLGTGSSVQLAVDDGDSVFYNDAIVAKDMAERRHAKFLSGRVVIDCPGLAANICGNGFESLRLMGDRAGRGGCHDRLHRTRREIVLTAFRVAGLLVLCAGSLVARAQSSDADVEKRFSAEEMHATGLDTLSSEQLALLNRLLRTHPVPDAVPVASKSPAATAQSGNTSAQAQAPSTASVPMASAPPRPPLTTDGKPVTSRLIGSVQRWAPGTLFELENGQQWRVLKGQVDLPKALQSPQVLVVSGIAGRWFLQIDENYPKARVERIR